MVLVAQVYIELSAVESGNVSSVTGKSGNHLATHVTTDDGFDRRGLSELSIESPLYRQE